MTKRLIYLTALASSTAGLTLANQQTVQSIDVVNNSNQPVHLYANCPAHSLIVNHTIPIFANYSILSTLTNLKAPQEMLCIAIINNSIHQIRQAISAGADVNQGKETPI
jgi:hypothetical protein